MKISKGETTLLLGTTAIVAAVLLGGAWVSQRAATARAAAVTAARAAANARVGRYRLTYDTKVKGKWTTLKHPHADIELKPSGQFVMHCYPGMKPIIGTYRISGGEIRFTWPSGFTTLTRQARWTKTGFSSSTYVFVFNQFWKNHRYIKISNKVAPPLPMPKVRPMPGVPRMPTVPTNPPVLFL